jgi:hypothetical protein
MAAFLFAGTKFDQIQIDRSTAMRADRPGGQHCQTEKGGEQQQQQSAKQMLHRGVLLMSSGAII